ncbi:MAG: 1-phosphofructokinase family hexose kinase [Fusobacteriaceae bacterium]
MILTITLNTAVDIRYTIENFSLLTVNRVNCFEKTPGGKGLNVSKVLKILNTPILASGFLGGSNGLFIEKELSKLNIFHDFFKIKDETRNCIAILDSKNSTEILEPGPTITSQEWTNFLEFYEKLLLKSEYISISGSLPRGLNGKHYRELIEIANSKQKKVFFDSSGENFIEGIKGKPFFIKPNFDEIEYLLGEKLNSWTDILNFKNELSNLNIENILITLGKDGALFLHNNNFYKVTIPQVEIKNCVGSGDSTVAGFIYSVKNKFSIDEALKYSLACGTSNAMEDTTGKVDLNTINNLKKFITIIKI